MTPQSVSSPRDATILLVEDDEALARILMRTMGGEGYEVIHANTGDAAVRHMRSRSFDAVLCDLNLPDASGVDVLRIARAGNPSLPLLLMSGCATLDTAVEAGRLGVLEYIVKPTSNDNLKHLLDRATSGARRTPMRRRPSDAEPRTVGAQACGLLSRDAAIIDARASVLANLEASFERAMASLSVVLEPIPKGNEDRIHGFAPRVRSAEKGLATERELLAAAERLGRVRPLCCRLIELASKAFADPYPDASYFLDTDDEESLTPGALWARIAKCAAVQS